MIGRMLAATGGAVETGGKVATVALGAKEVANRMFEITLPSIPELAVLLPVVVSALWAVKLTLDIGFSLYDRMKSKRSES
ncbi:hypothetical protein AVP3_0033 [Aeromonas phage AVP3]|jgi:hypothetical protein|nr:hypothetical protein [Aeromonas phage BUCT552]